MLTDYWPPTLRENRTTQRRPTGSPYSSRDTRWDYDPARAPTSSFTANLLVADGNVVDPHFAIAAAGLPALPTEAE